jgi:hypothetical protein
MSKRKAKLELLQMTDEEIDDDVYEMMNEANLKFILEQLASGKTNEDIIEEFDKMKKQQDDNKAADEEENDKEAPKLEQESDKDSISNDIKKEFDKEFKTDPPVGRNNSIKQQNPNALNVKKSLESILNSLRKDRPKKIIKENRIVSIYEKKEIFKKYKNIKRVLCRTNNS